MNDNQHIPSGYKPSPLGIIPEDWEVKRLGDCFDICAGRDLITETYSPTQTVKHQYPIFSNSLENKGLYGYTSTPRHKANSITITGRGSLGHAEYRKQDFDAIIRLLVLTPKIEISCELITNYINFTQPFIYESTGVPQLTAPQIQNTKLLLPPYKEQLRIMDVLHNWDTAIEKQTALIEQLTLRKRGLMQQLLTGKKRLKGFEGGNFHRLGNYISECNRRNVGCNRVLSVTKTRGFILQEEQFDKIVASNDTSNYKVVCRGEFAYNPSRVNVGSLAMLNDYDEGILSPMYIVFKANENIDKTYLLQCLQSWWFRGHIPAYTQGSVRDSLSFDGLCSMKFYIPTLQEQKAISSILERADKEIEIQKQKLAAMQAQKKGLMQVLLSGKKRLLFKEE